MQFVRKLLPKAHCVVDSSLASAMQQRRPPPQPIQMCTHFLQGHCRFGTACRFSHDTTQEQRTGAALPFDHRQYVQSLPSRASLTEEPSWRFRVMTYNVLADCLAHEHAAELYRSAPRFSLEWSYRSELLVREILHHRPDIVCLQEVDHYLQFRQALQQHGYEGVYTKRTGDRRDGLAMFWHTDALRPVNKRFINFKDQQLKDNVAQLLVFEQRSGDGYSSNQTSSDGSAGSLSGQKWQQRETPPSMSCHLRFDSSSEGEGDSGSASSLEWRAGVVGAAAPTAVAASLASLADAMAIQHDSDGGRVQAQVEDATESPGADVALLAAASSRQRLPLLVVAQTHCLFNPKRGDIKLGQVRTLLEHVDSLCLQQQKRYGQRAAAVVCGDFNSAAGSPIYQFMRSGELDLSQHDRRSMSGQVESTGRNWRGLQRSFLLAQQQQTSASGAFQVGALTAAWQHLASCSSSQGSASSWPRQPPAMLRASATELTDYSNSSGGRARQQQAVTPYAPPPEGQVGSDSVCHGSSHKSMRPWGAEDVRLAAGSNTGGALVARHPIHIESAYRAVTGSEAAYSTCHDKFIGCVDYMWYSNGDARDPWRLTPLGVLQPPPLETLHSALPSPAWPSDHISLVCDFALCVPS